MTYASSNGAQFLERTRRASWSIQLIGGKITFKYRFIGIDFTRKVIIESYVSCIKCTREDCAEESYSIGLASLRKVRRGRLQNCQEKERARKWEKGIGAEARLGILLGCRRTGGGSCGRRGRVFDTSPNRRWSIAAEIIDDRPGRLITIAGLSSGDLRLEACISSWRTRERKRRISLSLGVVTRRE